MNEITSQLPFKETIIQKRQLPPLLESNSPAGHLLSGGSVGVWLGHIHIFGGCHLQPLLTALQLHHLLKSRCLLIRRPFFTLLSLHLFTLDWSQVFNMHFLVYAFVRELFQNWSKFSTQTIPKTGKINMQWHSLVGEQFVLFFLWAQQTVFLLKLTCSKGRLW